MWHFRHPRSKIKSLAVEKKRGDNRESREEGQSQAQKGTQIDPPEKAVRGSYCPAKKSAMAEVGTSVGPSLRYRWTFFLAALSLAISLALPENL